MDREVIDLLQETQKNLKARRMDPAVHAIGRGIALIWKAEEARQVAVNAAAAIPGLNNEIANLKRQVAFLQGEVAKAQDEAKRAAIPRLEAQAEARREVRDMIRPYLNGDTGIRMVALTIWNAMNAAWGKEKS